MLPTDSIIQRGPTCGIVATAMAAAAIKRQQDEDYYQSGFETPIQSSTPSVDQILDFATWHVGITTWYLSAFLWHRCTLVVHLVCTCVNCCKLNLCVLFWTSEYYCAPLFNAIYCHELLCPYCALVTPALLLRTGSTGFNKSAPPFLDASTHL